MIAQGRYTCRRMKMDRRPPRPRSCVWNRESQSTLGSCAFTVNIGHCGLTGNPHTCIFGLNVRPDAAAALSRQWRRRPRFTERRVATIDDRSTPDSRRCPRWRRAADRQIHRQTYCLRSRRRCPPSHVSRCTPYERYASHPEEERMRPTSDVQRASNEREDEVQQAMG